MNISIALGFCSCDMLAGAMPRINLDIFLYMGNAKKPRKFHLSINSPQESNILGKKFTRFLWYQKQESKDTDTRINFLDV